MTGSITQRMTVKNKIKVMHNNFLFYYYLIIRYSENDNKKENKGYV